jgi:hypothetical protein
MLRDGLLVRGAEKGGDARGFGPGPHRVHASSQRGRSHGRGQGQDEERHGQLDQREAARPLAGHLAADHEVTSALSPSPPGAPSAPRLQMS